jgi:hypothetical protein
VENFILLENRLITMPQNCMTLKGKEHAPVRAVNHTAKSHGADAMFPNLFAES